MYSLTYEIHDYNEPGMPFIFYKGPGHGEGIRNWHVNMEVIYIIKGFLEVNCDGEYYECYPGDIFLVNSKKFHQIVGEEGTQVMVYIVDQGFCLDNGINVENIFFRNLIRDEKLNKLLFEVEELYYERDFSYRIAALRSKTLEFMMYLIMNHIQNEGEGYNKKSKIFETAVNYINANFNKPITLEEVAKKCYINKSHLSREFRKASGMTVFKYINTIRCMEANRRIKEGSDAGAAALGCGFENMSYFTRTYKKIIGELPSETKRKLKK